MNPGKKKPSSFAVTTGTSTPSLLAASFGPFTVQSAISITPLPSLLFTSTAPIRIRSSSADGVSIKRPKYIVCEAIGCTATDPEAVAKVTKRGNIYPTNIKRREIQHKLRPGRCLIATASWVYKKQATNHFACKQNPLSEGADQKAWPDMCFFPVLLIFLLHTRRDLRQVRGLVL
jgi:hypothetical protein